MDNIPSNWQFTDTSNSVVGRTYPDGMQESCLITREDVQVWIAQGNTILPPTGN